MYLHGAATSVTVGSPVESKSLPYHHIELRENRLVTCTPHLKLKSYGTGNMSFSLIWCVTVTFTSNVWLLSCSHVIQSNNIGTFFCFVYGQPSNLRVAIENTEISEVCATMSMTLSGLTVPMNVNYTSTYVWIYSITNDKIKLNCFHISYKLFS